MYDVIFLSDIYVPGGTNFHLASNIRLLRSLEKRVGIIPINLPHAQGPKPINRLIRQTISDGYCEIIDRSRNIARCQLFIIDNPRLITPHLPLNTEICAERNVILVPFPPRNGAGETTFEPEQVIESVEIITDGDFVWAPVSSLVRNQLARHYPNLPLSELNAHPIIDAHDYSYSSEIRNKRKIVIGRHSRPEKDKWPSSRSTFLKIYPDCTPFEVAFLGIDAPSLSSIIGSIPENYRLYPFDSIAPREFLKTIDFFVYFHNKSWVEAFGIVIAEAMARGAICVLPRYMEQNFEDAAVYSSAENVRAEIIRYHRNKQHYREKSRWARRYVQKNFSRAHFQKFLEEFGIDNRPKKRVIQRKSRKYDAVYVADFSSPKIFNYAFVEDILRAALDGQNIALRDVRDGDRSQGPFAELVTAEHRLDVLDAEQHVECNQLVINDPWRVVLHSTDLSRVRSKSSTLLFSYPNGDIEKIQRYLGRMPGLRSSAVEWAPRDVHSRIWLETFDPNLPLSVANYPARVSETTRRLVEEYRGKRILTPRRTIGILGLENADDVGWLSGLLPNLQSKPTPIFTYFGERPGQADLDARIVCTGHVGIDLAKWTAKLDRLIVVNDRLRADNLDYVIELCRVAGIPILYRSRHNKEKGNGAQSIEGLDARALWRAFFAKLPSPRSLQAPETRQSAELRTTCRPRPNGGAGAARHRANAAGAGSRRRAARPTLLFVSQNGTGVGHVVRQLAIARKLSSDYECIFLTMSQAVRFIAAFGFHTEYFPSSVYSGVSYTDWLYWLRKKVDMMLDAWEIGCLVFDGNVPYASMVESAAARRDVLSVWIRRGMWPDSDTDRRRLAAQTYFDMLIEPGDFAERCDRGPTRQLRDTVRLVPPIQLLERDELLPRGQACQSLGIDETKTNVLVQLGSGNNRDTQSLLRGIATALAPHPNIQIYNLRWPISDVPPVRLENIPDVSLFPTARYYPAFDFSISAAGYNTAHEVLNFALPTIFVPNETEGMDNQSARAEFSASRGLALAGGRAALSANLHKMLDGEFRQAMRNRLRRLRLQNGAGEAAQLIDQLARQRR